jgi:CBS domain containing-hemolysin-like protein
MGEWLLVLAAVVLTIGTAVFVAAEFSLVALGPADRAARGGCRR